MIYDFLLWPLPPPSLLAGSSCLVLLCLLLWLFVPLISHCPALRTVWERLILPPFFSNVSYFLFLCYLSNDLPFPEMCDICVWSEGSNFDACNSVVTNKVLIIIIIIIINMHIQPSSLLTPPKVSLSGLS